MAVAVAAARSALAGERRVSSLGKVAAGTACGPGPRGHPASVRFSAAFAGGIGRCLGVIREGVILRGRRAVSARGVMLRALRAREPCACPLVLRFAGLHGGISRVWQAVYHAAEVRCCRDAGLPNLGAKRRFWQ